MGQKVGARVVLRAQGAEAMPAECGVDIGAMGNKGSEAAGRGQRSPGDSMPEVTIWDLSLGAV